MPWAISDGKVFYFAKNRKDLPELAGCNVSKLSNMPTQEHVDRYERMGFEVVIYDDTPNIPDFTNHRNQRP